MIDTLEAIFNNIKTDWPVLNDQQANDSLAYDYIVYKLPPGSSEKYRDNLILELTLWSKLNDRDTSHLEEEWGNLDRELRNLMYMDDKVWLRFQKISMGAIPDPDKNVQRRELRYLVKREERIDY